MVKIGIIGVGNTIGIARNHIDAYNRCPDAVVTAVYDIRSERAQQTIDEMNSRLEQMQQEIEALRKGR